MARAIPRMSLSVQATRVYRNVLKVTSRKSGSPRRLM